MVAELLDACGPQPALPSALRRLWVASERGQPLRDHWADPPQTHIWE